MFYIFAFVFLVSPKGYRELITRFRVTSGPLVYLWWKWQSACIRSLHRNHTLWLTFLAQNLPKTQTTWRRRLAADPRVRVSFPVHQLVRCRRATNGNDLSHWAYLKRKKPIQIVQYWTNVGKCSHTVPTLLGYGHFRMKPHGNVWSSQNIQRK